jgi:hypothetical protein
MKFLSGVLILLAGFILISTLLFIGAHLLFDSKSIATNNGVMYIFDGTKGVLKHNMTHGVDYETMCAIFPQK